MFLLFALGILIGGELPIEWWKIWWILLPLLATYALLNNRRKLRKKSPLFIHTLFIVLIIILGSSYIKTYNYISELTLAFYHSDTEKYQGILLNKLKSGTRQRWIISLNCDHCPSIKVLAIMPENSDCVLKEGMNIALEGNLTPVPPPKNPHAFDYSSFLSHQHIFRQIFIRDESISVLSENHITFLRRIAMESSLFVGNIFDVHFKSNKTRGLAKAIFLGDKIQLDEDIKQDFINIGAAHVLAVSGLHVGIFLGIFIWILDKIKLNNPWWRYAKLTFLLSLLIFYIIITGASPSVVRAGIMFGLYLIGKYTVRCIDTVNMLGIVGAGMLLYDPHFIYQLSFQFSFIALASILYFYPFIEKWYVPKSKIDGYCWSLISVTLAAQVLILPIVIFYFQRFPTYFILSSLVMIPLTFLVICGCVILVLLQLISPEVNAYCSQWVEMLFESMIIFSEKLAKFPLNSIDNLYISKIELALYSLILLLVIWLLRQRQKSVFILTLACVFMLAGVRMQQNLTKKNQQMMSVYALQSGWCLDVFIGNTCIELVHTAAAPIALDYARQPNRTRHAIRQIEKFSNNKIFSINGFTVMNADNKLNISALDSCYHVDVLIIDDCKRAFPDIILNNVIPKNVILTPSASKKVRQAWENSFFFTLGWVHDLKKHGAFTVHY